MVSHQFATLNTYFLDIKKWSAWKVLRQDYFKGLYFHRTIQWHPKNSADLVQFQLFQLRPERLIKTQVYGV